MLLLGVLAAQAAAAPAGASDYDLLETEILTGTASSVTFSSLNSTYGADYQHLQIRYVVRDNRPTNASIMFFRVNGTAGNNYASHMLYGNGSTVTSTNWTNTSNPYVGWTASNTSAANSYGAGVMDIMDAFETTKNKTWRVLSGVTDATWVALASGFFHGAASGSPLAAIDSITLYQETSNDFVAGSRFSLYGLKAA